MDEVPPICNGVVFLAMVFLAMVFAALMFVGVMVLVRSTGPPGHRHDRES